MSNPNRSNIVAEKTDQDDGGSPSGNLWLEEKILQGTRENDSCTFHCEVYNTFVAMNLDKKLLQGIEEYGYYEPSTAQQKALVPLCKGFDVIVQGESNPRKTATICLWILQGLDCKSDKCQALVLTKDSASAQEIGKDMQALGKYLDVKVYVLGYPLRSSPIPPVAHVVVTTVNYLRSLLNGYSSKHKVPSLSCVKMIAVDEPDYMMQNQFYFLFCILPRLEERFNSWQIGVFSEFWPTKHGVYIKYLMKSPLIIQVDEPDKLTLKDIEAHMVSNIEDEVSKIKELQRLMDAIDLPYPRIVIFVNSSEMVDRLAVNIQNHLKCQWEVCTTNKEMNQTARNQISEELSNPKSPYALITTDVWAVGIDFQTVCLVVNYDYDAIDYFDRVGRFKRVSVMSFVTQGKWETLFDIQRKYMNDDVRFVPFRSHRHFQSKDINDDVYSDIFLPFQLGTHSKHVARSLHQYLIEFVYPPDDMKLGGIDCLMVLILQTQSIVYVNIFDEVDLLQFVKQVQEACRDFKGCEQVQDECSKFRVFTKVEDYVLYEDPCILIATDRIFKDFDRHSLHHFLLKKVPLVINCDPPLSATLYSHRLACCKRDGVVVHFVTKYDWLGLLNFQREYMCTICQYPDVEEVLPYVMN